MDLAFSLFFFVDDDVVVEIVGWLGLGKGRFVEGKALWGLHGLVADICWRKYQLVWIILDFLLWEGIGRVE